jgi:hypothetical protein
MFLLGFNSLTSNPQKILVIGALKMALKVGKGRKERSLKVQQKKNYFIDAVKLPIEMRFRILTGLGGL